MSFQNVHTHFTMSSTAFDFCLTFVAKPRPSELGLPPIKYECFGTPFSSSSPRTLGASTSKFRNFSYHSLKYDVITRIHYFSSPDIELDLVEDLAQATVKFLSNCCGCCPSNAEQLVATLRRHWSKLVRQGWCLYCFIQGYFKGKIPG